MMLISNFGTRRQYFYFCLATGAVITCLLNLALFTNIERRTIQIPGLGEFIIPYSHAPAHYANDNHPIQSLMEEANEKWEKYESSHSTNFRHVVSKYRQANGRHPPPGFKDWYLFARKNKVHDVDNFQQIMDDLRPFWAIPPAEIRKMAASLQESQGIAGIRIRDHHVVSEPNGWRAETLSHSIERIAAYLPDMDIAMNTLDQPRVMATYEDIQDYLKIEARNRTMFEFPVGKFTRNMLHLYDPNATNANIDPGWFSVAGKPYMEFAQESCSPGSPARNDSMGTEEIEKLYKTPVGGFISNFTGSSDLCTVGPILGDQHGFLFSASSNVITRKLLPVFGECKVSVNNDILFPANMYFLKDPRYVFNPLHDKSWNYKDDSLLWRGVTSGGIQVEDNWHRLHRQRFVHMTNATEMNSQTVSILSQDMKNGYQPMDFQPAEFATSYFDVGFTEAWGCIPDCSFYDNVWTYKEPKDFSEQFKAKYLVDIDGHSFSGRWRAFHQSRSLGLKATIFREWHDSRLLAWRHFVPMDNMYGDLYSLMTYFIGMNSSQTNAPHDAIAPGPAIASHDFEAQMIATQSREWAQLALRDEDLEIYLYLLLLEYGRIIDDNRDVLGYAGDGSELAEFDVEYQLTAPL
ncbi:uncharacterized protein N7483_003313 [Penicillium malachiteum]|uniref:uncharacterized protein n=1 Tax=Penicillium malachiteum TaxID=1324776 RepID=UPI002547761B|nr:uncharacterized protein N7483_003313 [Penicillium malachiteum]KAJ5728805.1 hypothetical protein N7483_003313 [Penicillium malachiteum]